MPYQIFSNTVISKLKIRQYLDRRYFGEFWAVATNLITPLANFAAMAIIMKFVKPSDLGIFQTVFLVVPYFAFVPLGVFNGLRRNIAFYNGQGNVEKARRQSATSMFIAHVTALIGVGTATAVFIYSWYSGASPLTLLCSLGLMVNLALFSYNTHYTAVFSGYKAFKALGTVNIVKNLVSVLGALFPIFIGAFGLVLRSILSMASAITVRVFSSSDKIVTKSKFHKQEYRDLVTSGFPIMLSGYLSSIMVVADRSVIAAFLGTQDLGYYALTGYLLSAVILVPQSFSLVLYPKAAEAYGKTGKPEVLRKYLLLSLLLNLSALIPLGFLCFFFLENIVINLFPNYINGIRSAQIACFAVVLLSYSGANIVFMVLKRNIPYQIAICIGFISIWLFGYLAIRNGHGIEGVAVVRSFATMIVAFTTVTYAFFLTKRSPNSIDRPYSSGKTANY
jgi:O-antigen/teichoic acid export membrane protein